jgi:hypothetical protein
MLNQEKKSEIGDWIANQLNSIEFDLIARDKTKSRLERKWEYLGTEPDVVVIEKLGGPYRCSDSCVRYDGELFELHHFSNIREYGAPSVKLIASEFNPFTILNIIAACDGLYKPKQVCQPVERYDVPTSQGPQETP